MEDLGEFLKSTLNNILKLSGSDVAAWLAIMGVQYESKIIDGFLRRGYGIKSNGSFYFNLPDDYVKEKNRYIFNFIRSIAIISIIIIILLITAAGL